MLKYALKYGLYAGMCTNWHTDAIAVRVYLRRDKNDMIMMTCNGDLNWWYCVWKWCVAAGAAAGTALMPGVPYMLLCTGFVLLDCWSACALGRRVARVHPDAAEKDAGKVKSWKLAKVVPTLAEIYAVILLAHFTQVYVADGCAADLRKVVAGAVCGWQFWSYLENCASCNGAVWAGMARKFLADKTARHLNIDLDKKR